MAALLSTIDGLLSSAAVLLNMDIYSRFIKPGMSEKGMKTATAIIQIAIVAIVLLIIPVYLDGGSISYERSAYEVLLEFLGSIMGVLIAIFILGIFFTRTTAKASFIGMLVGIILGFYLLNFTQLNFAHVGTIQFIIVIITGIAGSLFEKPKSLAELENLTIWTVKGVKGPFIGFHSWPGLKIWIIALPAAWLTISLVWEWYIRN
jgi:SSS family solute:Na+ symporter